MKRILLKATSRTRELLEPLLRSWFDLTADEQRAVVIVLFLFTLGILVRTFR